MNEISKILHDSVLMFSPILEIIILTILIYRILYYLRDTRAANILAGMVLVLILLTTASEALNFEVFSWLLNSLWLILPTAFIVIFQPELRRAFAQFGSSPFINQNRERKRATISEIATAAINMSQKKIGALIIFQRQIGMGTIVDDAIKLDTKINSHILESIFFPNSPLHDGAIIVRDNKIIAGHAILPLSHNDKFMPSLGTRHRAAVGITEETDAVALIVSEETGHISIACRGRLKTNVPSDKLQRFLSGLIIPGSSNNLNSFFENLPEDSLMSAFSNDDDN
ncbi:diadenylate cyclase CdaA [Lentisphaerota bacterium WC36G]|nr:diadenylate cyclase CdaA [Lentisphaerae bacterium WC36]